MFQKGEFDGLDRGAEWRYPLSFEAWIEFLDLCRESPPFESSIFFSLSLSLSFPSLSPSLFPSRRSVSGSSIALSKWDCIRLAERSATVTVNNYSGQWRKPWQLPIIAISPWQTPTYCRRTIYDDAEMRVVTFAVIIPPRRNSAQSAIGNFSTIWTERYSGI